MFLSGNVFLASGNCIIIKKKDFYTAETSENAIVTASSEAPWYLVGV